MQVSAGGDSSCATAWMGDPVCFGGDEHRQGARGLASLGDVKLRQVATTG